MKAWIYLADEEEGPGGRVMVEEVEQERAAGTAEREAEDEEDETEDPYSQCSPSRYRGLFRGVAMVSLMP